MNGWVLGAAATAWVVSAWQLEVIFIGSTSGWNGYDFPFYLGGRLTFSMARDLFYAVNLFACLLAVVGGAL